MKTANRSMMEMAMNLIFNGDWDSIEDFDEQLDCLTEYANSIRESINGFNEQMMMA